MNPELLRNLWLQFSLERTVAAPLIIGAVFALVAFVADGGWSEVGSAANIGFLVIVYLWGTRRAVNVLADEITSGTWDGQRMSSIGPWSMAWSSNASTARASSALSVSSSAAIASSGSCAISSAISRAA